MSECEWKLFKDITANSFEKWLVTNENGNNDLGNGLKTGFRHDESPSVTVSQGSEDGARCRVRTCDFLRVKQVLMFREYA